MTRRWGLRRAVGGRMSLRVRVALVLVVSYQALVLGFLHRSLSARAADLRGSLTEAAQLSVRLVERTVAEQAVIGDYAAIHQTLEACAREPEIEGASFRDPRGRAVEARSRASADPVPLWFATLFPLEAAPVTADVSLGGVSYGSLRLVVDAGPSRHLLYESFVTQVRGSLVILASILALSWLTLRPNLRTLVKIQEAARRLESGDYSARVAVPASSPPELRQTAGAFNAMGERTGALVTALSEQTRAVDEAALLVESGLDGVVTRVNARLAALAGEPGDRLRGLPVAQLLAGPGSEPFPAALWATIAAGTSWRGEAPLRTSREAAVWVDLTLTPVRGAAGEVEKVLGIGFDVSDKRRAALDLRESRQMLRLVLDNVPQHVFWKDRQSTYLGANLSFARAAGMSTPEEVAGKTDFDLPWKDTEAERYRTDDRTVVETGVPKLRYLETQRMSDGRLAHVETSKVPLLDGEGSIVGVLGTYEDVTERRAAAERIEHLAFHDALTGLPNRVLLRDRLAQAIAGVKRSGRPFAVILLDLDGFKGVNDHHGHHQGDLFLKEMGGRLSAIVRATDTVSRLGGDEFVLIVSDLATRDDVARAVDRVMATVREPITVDGLPVSVTASVGVTVHPADDADGDGLLRHADVAMYQAKEEGRDRFLFFSPDMARAASLRLVARGRVAAALRAHELVLHFQPTVNMRTGEVVGAEALLRWAESGHGLRLPGEFLPAVEDSDVIVELGAWVAEEAVTNLERWREAGHDLKVGINVAARQIQHPSFVEVIEGTLERHASVPPDRVELEILETAALGDLALVRSVMTQLGRRGVRFCLDDFGTGYSSLAYFRQLPISVVKIDQGFVRDMLDDREDLAIIEGVVSMAAIFGRTVVAEGVSSPEHGAALLRLGCDLAQGFGIARAMPADELLPWIARWKPHPAWMLAGEPERHRPRADVVPA